MFLLRIIGKLILIYIISTLCYIIGELFIKYTGYLINLLNFNEMVSTILIIITDFIGCALILLLLYKFIFKGLVRDFKTIIINIYNYIINTWRS